MKCLNFLDISYINIYLSNSSGRCLVLIEQFSVMRQFVVILIIFLYVNKTASWYAAEIIIKLSVKYKQRTYSFNHYRHLFYIRII